MAAVPIKVPKVSESISEGILANWLKPDGSTFDLSVVPTAAKNTSAALLSTFSGSNWTVAGTDSSGNATFWIKFNSLGGQNYPFPSTVGATATSLLHNDTSEIGNCIFETSDDMIFRDDFEG